MEKVFKNNIRQKTIDMGSTENIKQDKYPQNLPLGLSYLNCRKVKTEKILNEARAEKYLIYRRTKVKLFQTYCWKSGKQKESGVKYINC